MAAHQDQLLEIQIELAWQELNSATDKNQQHAAWERMVSLICYRSPEQIARMERVQGLR